MKNYSVAFGSGNPQQYSGMTPTLLVFFNLASGLTLPGPTFTEGLTGSGIYTFQYGATTPIAFIAYSVTTSPGSVGSYVSGQIDPADRSDEYGTSILAVGLSNYALMGANISLSVIVGTTASTIGGISALPGDLFGYMMRLEQLFSGQQQFTKGIGQLQLYDRTGSTLLVQRTITNSASLVTKI